MSWKYDVGEKKEYEGGLCAWNKLNEGLQMRDVRGVVCGVEGMRGAGEGYKLQE